VKGSLEKQKARHHSDPLYSCFNNAPESLQLVTKNNSLNVRNRCR